MILKTKRPTGGGRRALLVECYSGERNGPPLSEPPESLQARHPGGKMDPDGGGYIPRTMPGSSILTEPGTGRTDRKGRSRRVGRDPMTIPSDVLTAAGHPPRRTSAVVSALSAALDLDLRAEFDLVEYRDLRRYCLTCADSSGAVRHCAIINCPAWGFRMGRNPHNPKRGRNPFGGQP